MIDTFFSLLYVVLFQSFYSVDFALLYKMYYVAYIHLQLFGLPWQRMQIIHVRSYPLLLLLLLYNAKRYEFIEPRDEWN